MSRGLTPVQLAALFAAARGEDIPLSARTRRTRMGLVVAGLGRHLYGGPAETAMYPTSFELTERGHEVAAQLGGLIEQARRRQTGGLVGVYDGAVAGMDTTGERDGDPTHPHGAPYSTVCEAHGSIISHATLTLARWHASDPQGWCEDCRA